MGFLVGATLGLGIFLLLAAWMWPAEPRKRKHTTNWRTALLPGATFVFAFLLVYLITKQIIISIALAIGSTLVVVMTRARREATQRETLRHAWPEALDEVVSALRAGLSVAESLASLEHRGPAVLRPYFATFAGNVRSSGRLSPSLDVLKNSLHDPVADRVIEAMRLAADVGGRDLGSMLSTLATWIRQDNRMRGELQARQSWTVNGARLAAVAPWLILLLLGTQPGTIEVYATPFGVLVLVFGLVSTIAAYALMIRLGRLPADERVLTAKAVAK